MKKKLNFLVDNSKSTEEVLQQKMLTEFGAGYQDDVNIIFGSDLRVGQKVKVPKTYNSPSSQLCNMDLNTNSFDYCCVDGLIKPANFTLDEQGNTFICSFTYTEDDDSEVTPKNIMYSILSEYFIKENKALIINDVVIMGNDSVEKSDNVYIDDTYNCAIVFDEDTTELIASPFKFFTKRAIVEDGVKYLVEEITLNKNYDDDGDMFLLFVYKGDTYKSEGFRDLLKMNQDGEFVDCDIREIKLRDAGNGVLTIILKDVILGDDEHKRDSTKYAELIDGVYYISDGTSEVPYKKYRRDGLVQETEYAFSIEKMVAGASTDEVMSIVNNNLVIPETKDIVHAVLYDKHFRSVVENLVQNNSNIIENLRIRLLESREFYNALTDKISTNSTFMNTIESKIKENVLSSINVNLVASDGTTIASNLIYDEENHKYVLDYDTSLLDGTGYTIELSLK